MSGNTSIEWADKVWNPVTGCTKVSQGCKNCYAEKLHNMRHKAYLAGKHLPAQYRYPFEVIQLHPERMEDPLHWKKPQRVFVNSMSDLFHPDVPDEFIKNVFHIMHQAYWHTFMVLTKRPDRMHRILRIMWREDGRLIFYPGPMGVVYALRNVWLGVSVENQQAADERVPLLLQTPAAVRFVSVEPMLGPVNLGIGVCPQCGGCGETAGHYSQADGMDTCDACGGSGRADEVIDWVIAGCESGPNRRDAAPNWFRSLRDQCQNAGIPFFLKQMYIDGHLVKMPALDGRVWAEFPEVTP